MSFLAGKNILVGVTGGIAAYKIPMLLRLLVSKKANVKVIMTKSAKKFVTEMTLATLSKHPVITGFKKKSKNKLDWNSHVNLALWADVFLIAPATANTISKMANGNSDNFFVATYLSSRGKVYIAPAMDLDMYKHPTTSQNLEKLKSFGHYIIAPNDGELASGLFGKGRMKEVEEIVEKIEIDISSNLPLLKKKVLVTAGPTYEAIDPVRFIGNHSSGKMGYAIAEEFANQGAQVYLISGPTQISLSNNLINLLKITSSDQMYERVLKFYDDCDIVIMSAAVSDFKPNNILSKKIKKESKLEYIELKPTVDILKELGKLKKKQFLVGFALEDENELDNAIKKIEKKNLDLIVLNSLKDKGAGFNSDTNKVTLVNKEKEIKKYDLKSKKEVASNIVSYIKKKSHVL